MPGALRRPAHRSGRDRALDGRPAGEPLSPSSDPVDYGQALTALEAAYAGITAVVSGLTPEEFLRPTLADGWDVADLLFHQLLDAQRALIALASPTTEPADVDFVSYWRPFRPDSWDGGLAHARFVRLSATAYASPAALVEQWTATSAAVVRAAAAGDPAGRVCTQGHVLALPDFLTTLAVEATIHHLDLTAHLPEARPADPAGLALVRRTLDGLLGIPLPVAWTDEEYAVKGTGREQLSAADREAFGETADRLPLLG